MAIVRAYPRVLRTMCVPECPECLSSAEYIPPVLSCFPQFFPPPVLSFTSAFNVSGRTHEGVWWPEPLFWFEVAGKIDTRAGNEAPRQRVTLRLVGFGVELLDVGQNPEEDTRA